MNIDRLLEALQNYKKMGGMRLYSLRKKLASFVKQNIWWPPHHKFIIMFLKKNGLLEDSILLAGFPKSGNTWTRFVIFNYFNIMLNDANDTLTHEQLNQIQCHTFEDNRVSTNEFIRGFPIFFRTHGSYRRIFNDFSDVIFFLFIEIH